MSKIFPCFKTTSDNIEIFQRNGGSIGEEIMENNDIGEHEDTDVKNERQKVFNLITSSAVQDPPVVLVQVNNNQ